MKTQLQAALPLHLYGVGVAKTFDKLWHEIESGETTITWEDNRPIRIIKVARVEVLHGDQYLVETNQVFDDGRSRVRGIRGLSEKFMMGESPISAAKRAVSEELGLGSNLLKFKSVGQSVERKVSPSYPGLVTQYEFFDYAVRLDGTGMYVATGYIADEGDSTTYFGWV